MIHTYRNARRHYGGVCILLKEDILYDYNVSKKDTNIDTRCFYRMQNFKTVTTCHSSTSSSRKLFIRQ